MTQFDRLLLLSLVLGSSAASAGVYKCLDDNNKIFYQDKPCRELRSTGLSPSLSKLAPEESRARPLWKLTSGDRTIYLMASLSFGTAEMYPLPESVMDVFASSNVLAIVEDFGAGTDAAAKNPAILAKGSYGDGSTLDKHVKPATWQKTLALAKTLNIAEETLAPQRPWMAALTIKNAALRNSGFDEKLSVDKAFIKAAATQKPVVNIDPLENQAKYYEQLPEPAQEQLLLQAIYAADSQNAYFQTLVDGWKNGDPSSIEQAEIRVNEAAARADKSLESSLNEYNSAVADKLVEMAADGRIYFFVIDAKKLVGDKGILANLQGKGYKAAQL